MMMDGDWHGVCLNPEDYSNVFDEWVNNMNYVPLVPPLLETPAMVIIRKDM